MERVDLMKSIMRAKHLCDEQICWWPVAIGTGTQQPRTERPDIMASMIRLFAPTHVFCFGEQPQHSLKYYLSCRHDHIPDQTTIISLPAPEEMLPDNQDKKMQTWCIIKDLHL
ncbi:MAG TPA: hypothetical protein ENN39_12260 [Desulfonatronum sp.]|nr:hypothetical protein [Desulfonatronum sp.]